MDFFEKVPPEILFNIFEAIANTGNKSDVQSFRAVCARFNKIAEPSMHACTIIPVRKSALSQQCLNVLRNLEKPEISHLVKTLYIPSSGMGRERMPVKQFQSMLVKLEKILPSLHNLESLRLPFGRTSGSVLRILDSVGKPTYLKCWWSEDKDSRPYTAIKGNYGFPSYNSPAYLDLLLIRCGLPFGPCGHRLMPLTCGLILQNVIGRFQNIQSLDVDADALCYFWKHCEHVGKFPLIETPISELGIFRHRGNPRFDPGLDETEWSKLPRLLHLDSVEKLAMNYSHLSEPILSSPSKFPSLKCLRIDHGHVWIPIEDLFPWIAQVNALLRRVKVEELQLFTWNTFLDLSAVIHSGSTLRVLQYRNLAFPWDHSDNKGFDGNITFSYNCMRCYDPQTFTKIAAACPSIEMLSIDVISPMADYVLPSRNPTPQGAVRYLAIEMIAALSAFPKLHHLDLYAWKTGAEPLEAQIRSMFSAFRGLKTGCPLRRITVTQPFSTPGSVSKSMVWDAYDTGTFIDVKCSTLGERGKQPVFHPRDGWATPRLSMENRWYLPLLAKDAGLRRCVDWSARPGCMSRETWGGAKRTKG